MRITARTPILSHLFIISLPKIPKSNYAFTSPKRFSPFYSQNSKRFSSFLFQKQPMPPRHPPPPPSSSSTKIAVEYAKSNKSTCKKCANAIAKKSLRLGIVSPDARGFDVTKWHHLDCFPIGSAPVGSAEEINGFQELKSSDQEALKEFLDRCEKSSEKVHERDEDEGNEREERDSKKSKVDDPPPSSSTKIVVEYAKSNKSMCKKCAKAITFKSLRLGIVSRDARGFDVTKWHHLDCFSIGSAPVGSAEEINGFQELKSSDQEALKELLDRCGESSIKVHERDEDEGNEREESDSKKAQIDDPPPSTKIAVEYAKSNKSMCKKCAKAITFKALRLGIVSRDARGFGVTKWHHLDCFPIGSAPVGSAEAINGFQALKSSDQEALKELLDRCDESSVKLSTSDGEAEIDIAFSVSDVENKYKDATLLPKWKRFNTIIFLERDDGLHDSNKIAAFDFDGCLAKTSVKKVGADAWSLLYLSIPDKLQNLYNDGYKLVIFTNESNIERWKNKRQAAVDSKIGRLNNFIKLVKVPIQVFIACGLSESSSRAADPFRKPKPGMWHIMEKHFNSGISIDMDQSFYVGDAAGRDNDHSDADIKFAQAVGLKFYVPEEYFGA